MNQLWRRVMAAGGIVLSLAAAGPARAQGNRNGPTLAALFEAYAAGDVQAPARFLQTSMQFQRLRAADRNRLQRWLGAWDRRRALFVLELANQASLVAPAYSVPLLTVGREYMARRAASGRALDDDAAFERLWHQVALATLQRYQLAGVIESYAAAVAAARPAIDPELAARLQFARAVAQEQRCWAQRPALVRAGTPIRDANYAPLATGGRGRGSATPATEVSRRLGCLEETAARFSVAAEGRASITEARIRLAWTQFQLGRFPEALGALASIDAGDDRDLDYWARLFRGRIGAAMNRLDVAEGEYRSALDLYPHAQSAGVGLALVLFQTSRADEASAVATELRARATSVDPWWTYHAADARFIDRWIGELRRSAQ